jgi:hypothetical protein
MPVVGQFEIGPSENGTPLSQTVISKAFWASQAVAYCEMVCRGVSRIAQFLR